MLSIPANRRLYKTFSILSTRNNSQNELLLFQTNTFLLNKFVFGIENVCSESVLLRDASTFFLCTLSIRYLCKVYVSVLSDKSTKNVSQRIYCQIMRTNYLELYAKI